jgi:hypothetical protein
MTNRHIIQSLVFAVLMTGALTVSTLTSANTNQSKAVCAAGNHECLATELKQQEDKSENPVHRAFKQIDEQMVAAKLASKQVKAQSCDMLEQVENAQVLNFDVSELGQLTRDLGNGKLLSNIVLMFSDTPQAAFVDKSNQFTANLQASDYDAISKSDLQHCKASEVPVPAAAWLFGSALFGFVSLSSRRKI